MATKVVSLSEMGQRAEGYLSECARTGQPLVVELPDHRHLVVHPLEDDDDLIDTLIATNDEFRDMLARSAQSGKRPFGRTTE